jgi:hypothetical protein
MISTLVLDTLSLLLVTLANAMSSGEPEDMGGTMDPNG